MTRNTLPAVALAAVVVLSLVAGVGGSTGTADLGDADIDATQTDPNEAESTHAVVVPVTSGAESIHATFNDVVVDYTVGTPAADVSNVGAGTVERIGIDRDGDDPGTRIDVSASITTVSGKKDGAAVRIATAGELNIQRGDEIVVVLRPVQNPQNAGTAAVEVTINSQSGADTANGTVTYEYNDATVAFADQSTGGDTVVVDEVTLSEGGFVAVMNRSGQNPGEVRGVSGYLPPGSHEDVTVTLDHPVTNETTLYAQAFTDSNADRRFGYEATGGDVDGPYLTRDDNVMASDDAEVTLDGGGATPTPTATAAATPSPTATPTAAGTPTTTPAATPTDMATATPTDMATATPTPSPTRTGTLVLDDGVTTTPTATPGDAGDEPDGTDGPDPTDAPDPTDEPDTPSQTTGGSGQGFGALAALVAVLGAALLARRG